MRASAKASLSDLVVGVDTGGTFTDVTVMKPNGEAVFNKAPTTPSDFSRGVLNALGEVAKSMGVTVSELLTATRTLKHGTTVGTNALINRRGPKLGFITTRGFEDTPLIMRAVGRVDGLPERERKHMAAIAKPTPLVPKRRIRGVRERIDYAGEVVVPLNEVEVRQALRELVEEERVEAIGVSLLFAWVNPAHEQAIRRIVEELYPDGEVRLGFSHELAPVVREYARGNTVLVDAFLGSTMDTYLGQLETRLRDEGFSGDLMVMQANGGLAGLQEASAISTLSSGPAGGVIGSKFVAQTLGHQNVITTDMGGTSFDVGIIANGREQFQRDPLADRFRVIQPMIDVESIGAGGGTIARVDTVTRRLLLGPDSAGADPGPACYGAGGDLPTITDADLVLGFLDPDYFWGGRRKLSVELAEKAIHKHVAEPLGMTVVEAAGGIYELINHQMSNLIRKKVGQVGSSSERFVIYAFGGAGPVHCAWYAAQLGIPRVYNFMASPVFSSFGIATSDIIHSQLSSFYTPLPCDPELLNAHVEAQQNQLLDVMRREGAASGDVEFVTTFHMRYRRQLNELPLVVPNIPYDAEAIDRILVDFGRRYEEVYGAGSGYARAGVELVSIAVDAVMRTPKPQLAASSSPTDGETPEPQRTRQAWSVRDSAFIETAIYDFDALRPGHRIEGPSIIEAEIGNIVIPPSTTGTVDEYNNVIIDVEDLK